MLADADPGVRAEAAKRLDINVAQLDRALADGHPFVRKAAAGNPNATTAQLDQALADSDWRVRAAAAEALAKRGAAPPSQS